MIIKKSAKREAGESGFQTHVTDILRNGDLPPLFRRAGLLHVSLETEVAALLKRDMFNDETKVRDNRHTIQMLRNADIFTEALFIVGLDNETAETLEKHTTTRMIGLQIWRVGQCIRRGHSRHCFRNSKTSSKYSTFPSTTSSP